MAKSRSRQEDEEWTKDNEALAQFVRFNCPTSTTLFHGNEVHYFTGSKAVDTIYESKYGSKASGTSAYPTRRAAEGFMQYMLERKMIWRAKKLVPKKKEKNEEKKDATKSPKMKDPKTKKEKLKEKEEEEQVEETDADEKKKDEDKTDEKKKKVKLLEHPLQNFADGNDTFVWIYDPTPLYKKLIGILMIVSAIGCCCFPLWPPIVRQGVYYLSMTGIGFFGVIIVVAVLRTILFGMIWLMSGGEHKLWILPNLTEDVGFFESFQPWYSYERVNANEKKKDDKKKKNKEKNSDDDEGGKAEEKKANEEEVSSKDSSQGSGTGTDNSEDDAQESNDDEQNEEQPSPDQKPRKRLPRKEDGDYVIVDK